VVKGDSVLCYHQNGRISTVTYPDADAYSMNYRYTIVYDQKGNEVYRGGQGYKHGGGSLYLKYYANGAVSSARSTFQPDGGIQYHDETTYFNEDGTYLRKEDNSRNTHNPTVFSPVTVFTTQPPQTPPPAPKVDSVEVFIKNTTGKRISILIQAKSAKEKTLIHVKKKEVSIGKYLPIKGNHDPASYFDLIVIPDKKKKSAQVIWKPEFLEGTKNRLVLIRFK
jgi:hypothetical protein